jgi:parallel beta-helix repeat protein
LRALFVLLLAALPALALDEEIRTDVTLPPGPLNIRPPLRVLADGITVDLGEAVLVGSADGTDPDRFEGTGIEISGRKNVTIRGGKLKGFKCAILAKDCTGLVLDGVDVSGNFAQRLHSTPEREDGSDWPWPHENDEQQWRKNYGAGICLEKCFRATVRDCTGRHQQNGLILDRCEACRIYDNDFSFNSGWGIAMWRSCENMISRNKCDWCVRGYSFGVYDRGQDSAGILVFEQCSNNVFARNSATHSGDGFFLYAGHETTQRTGEGGSNDNVVKGNDFSHAVANAIEATFSRGNRFVKNRCDDSNYGIWGGYSYQTWIEGNTMEGNSVAGIAIEHGELNWIERNTIAGSPRGIWLWWDDDKELLAGPFGRKHSCKSSGYILTLNDLKDNKVGIFLENTSSWRINPPLPPRRDPAILETKGDCPEGSVTWPMFGERLPDWMDREFTLLTRPVELGSREPFLPKDHPRGRKYIMIGEWGPLDPTKPAVYPTEATGSCTYRVVGADAYEVTVPDGFQVEKDGSLFRVTSGPGLHDFTGDVRVGDQRFPFKGRLFHAKWTVSHWTWGKENDPRENGNWAALIATKPRTVTETDRIDFAWAGGGPKDVGTDHFATRAETNVTLPKGRYEIRTLSDDGVRVLVDGRVVQEDWTWHGPKENVSEVDLDAGEHAIVVEHFEIDGYAVLRLDIGMLAGNSEEEHPVPPCRVAAYSGKYVGDPRLDAIREGLPARAEAARRKLEDLLGEKVPPVEIRLEDAGNDRSGVFAESGQGFIALKTEYLVLGAFDVDKTLAHEMFHCLQRAKLGKRYDRLPEWAREGAALYVAGEGPDRARSLAWIAGKDGMAKLVNGLKGPHGLFDYYEDCAAFERVGARGRDLVKKLLETDDVAAAVKEVLGEDMATFEQETSAYARTVLAPILRAGNVPSSMLLYAQELARDGKDAEALEWLRGVLKGYRTEAWILGDAIRLEVELLRRTGSAEYAEAAKRAEKDLTVFPPAVPPAPPDPPAAK